MMWFRLRSLVLAYLLIIALFGVVGWFHDRHTVKQDAERHGDTWNTGDVWYRWLGNNADRASVAALVGLLSAVFRKHLDYVGSPVSRDGPRRREVLLQTLGRRRE